MKARASQNHDNKIATQVSFNPTAANIMSMEAPSGQNHDNKIAVQVNFNPTAVNIMDLLHIFVII